MYKKLYKCFQTYVHVINIFRKMTKFYDRNFDVVGVCLSSRTDAYRCSTERYF